MRNANLVTEIPTEKIDALFNALETARHELVTLHGLVVSDGAAPDETWSVDTNSIILQIDDALNGVSDNGSRQTTRPEGRKVGCRLVD